MNKEEMVEVVQFVKANWNIRNLTKSENTAMVTAWWEATGSFGKAIVMSEVKRFAIGATFPPRPMDIARHVVDTIVLRNGGRVPSTPKVALVRAQEFVDNANAGTPLEVDEDDLVIQVLRGLFRWSPAAFEEAYAGAYADFYLEQIGD